VKGQYHFNGNFKNASDLARALDALSKGGYHKEAAAEKGLVLEIFEKVFNHKAFTGRSGTFYGYEGLGSIYWHMVSKLLLAAQECCMKAIEEKAEADTVNVLVKHYYDIKAGIGVHKKPSLYGAFPTDPYSHTPAHRGAQQPGMTGQVKEDVLVRRTELGLLVKEGRLHFNPQFLKQDEFLKQPQQLEYMDVNGKEDKLELPAGSLFFSCCQVPVVYTLSPQSKLSIEYADGSVAEKDSASLDEELSRHVFERTGAIKRIHVSINHLS
jgi:hypothetical protein